MESGSMVCCIGCECVWEFMFIGRWYLSEKEGTGSQIITFFGGRGGENFPMGSRQRYSTIRH